ncbi:hypothetical protein GIB67_015723 [Kingdonia uniflora]|uniref:Uncharacterized protein n=1 Tax=Kingdonia uniflora TaxID=39325 RepID=A0A7J7NUB5_9MAGN|nr:hypothetical protein GIB67_015723 [Kingdonia uniflora]
MSGPSHSIFETRRNKSDVVKRGSKELVTHIWPLHLMPNNDPNLILEELQLVDILPDNWVHISIRSEELLNRDEIICRGSLDKVLKWYQWISRYPTLKALVDNMGFEEFLTIKARNSDNRLIHAPVERWPSTHTFNFPCGEFGVMPLNFVMLTGISFGRGFKLPYDDKYSQFDEVQTLLFGITQAHIRYVRVRLGYSDHGTFVSGTKQSLSPEEWKGEEINRRLLCSVRVLVLRVQNYGIEAYDGEVGDLGWFMEIGGSSGSPFKPPSYNDLRVKILKKKEETLNWIHTKKRNCLEHGQMRDLAYIQYNKRLKKHYEERISRKVINPIVLKSLDECAEWLVPDDARDDIAFGTDITYGVLEAAEDGFDDPPLNRTSCLNTASHCSQGGALSSRSIARHLQDSSDDDDYDVDTNYDMGDEDDDGINSGSDEDI